MTLSERLYNIAESAVDVSNTIIMIFISVAISFAIGYLIKKYLIDFIRNEILSHFSSAVTIQIFLIIIFFLVKDNVQAVRIETLDQFFNELETNGRYEQTKDYVITTWRGGLEAIRSNPKEKGYYLKTADIFVEKFGDYESAAKTLEYGLRVLKAYPIPPDFCERLKLYNQELPSNRPRLNNDCEKEIIVF